MKDIGKTIEESFILLIGTGSFTYGLFKFIAVVASSSTSYYRENLNGALTYLVVGVVAIVLWVVNKRGEKE